MKKKANNEKMPLRLKLFIKLLRLFSKRKKMRKVSEVRQIFGDTKGQLLLDYWPKKVYKIRNIKLDLPNVKLPIRLYYPDENKSLKPTIVLFHGGGFMAGTLDAYDRMSKRLCADNKMIIASIDYRLAPEHKFPIGLNDCYEATKWLYEKGEILGVDTEKIIVLGDSAGGNLAAAVCLIARDLGDIKIAAQVLLYPVTDATLSSKSIDDLGEHFLMNRADMKWATQQYIAKEEDVKNPYYSVLLAENLKNLRPTLIVTAEFDPLKDEGKAYAMRLKAAGNEVRFIEAKGLVHGFATMARVAKGSLGVFEEVREFLEFLYKK
ncbi:MAG: alpha/beta hydrolase [Chitinophagales bacterium]